MLLESEEVSTKKKKRKIERRRIVFFFFFIVFRAIMIENYNSKYIYVHDTRKKNNTKRNNCFVINTRKIIMKRLNEYKMILSKTIKYIKRKKN